MTNGAKIREGRFKCLEEFTCRRIVTIYLRLMNVVSRVAVADTERKPRNRREFLKGRRQPRLLVTVILLAVVALPTPESATQESTPTGRRPVAI